MLFYFSGCFFYFLLVYLTILFEVLAQYLPKEVGWGGVTKNLWVAVHWASIQSRYLLDMKQEL